MPGTARSRAARRNERFEHLMALAREGNAEARADLYREFEYEFTEGVGHEH